MAVLPVLGIAVLIGIAWAISTDRRRFPWRVVAWSLAIQVAFALLVLKTGPGQALFGYIGAFFTALLNYVDAGSSFVFGDAFGEHFFAFKVLPTIIFFAALMGVLYHLGLVQYVVMAFASVMQRTLRTSGAESLAAAANIFIGQTEAPLVVRPYVASMTRSELMALMVGGFATIAGGVLAAFVGLGIDAGHLVAASVISAPAALLVAKVMQPEVEESKTLGQVSIEVERTATFSSIGIQIGGIGGIAPERRRDLARLGFRAMLGGSLACFMTACVAGILL